MMKLRQAVVVEGKYDKAKLSSLLDAVILTTDGFDIFRDKAKLRMIRAIAEKDGLIILTDSDAAGFRIRAHIAGAIDPALVTHVYIPDLFGKERRKEKPGAEGKLGVEGIPNEILLEAFIRAGIVPESDATPPVNGQGRAITKADLLEWGLTGGEGSAARRQVLLKKLGFPARMNANALLNAVNRLYTYEAFQNMLKTLPR